MWEHTYFKALRGVNWWPVAILVGFMSVGLGMGSYYLEARHATSQRAPVAQRPVTPSELHEEPEQIFVPVDSVETVTPVQQAPAAPTTPRRVSRDVAATAPKPAEIVRQINEARRAAGVPAVREDALLDKSSTLKVTDMIARNYWDHHAPGESPWEAIRRVGYPYSYVGENLAYGQYPSSSETTIVQNWLKSSGHRKNMLNPQFKDIGIAVQKAQSFNGNREVYIIVTQYATRR